VDEKALTANEVHIWLSTVESEMRALGAKLEPLLDEQRRLEERQALLQGLLRSFKQAAPNGSAPAAKTAGSVARHVIDRAVEILRDEGRPMHINDLHARFVERGFAVPGAGKPVNLIVHLRNINEVVSPMRGIYGLPDQVDVMPKKARRSRRRKSTRKPRVSGGKG
jgi:hypothetical protein